jgi:glycosyltransferase involved in cell wall biosynthesis
MGSSMTNPIVSIVTPSYNRAEYLEDCIESIKNQWYDDFEHIVVDGGSTDGTLGILEDAEDDYNLRWISEDDDGMYDAIETGFEMANGDIYAWLNTDDLYFPWTLEVVTTTLSEPGIEWITGHPNYMKDDGSKFHLRGLRPYYRREWIERGWYNDEGLGDDIQQESTFWTAALWDRAGGFPTGIQYAGDFWLWRQMAAIEDLHTIDAVLAAHRIHSNQLSNDQTAYHNEVDTVRPWLAKVFGQLHVHNLYSLYRLLSDR